MVVSSRSFQLWLTVHSPFLPTPPKALSKFNDMCSMFLKGCIPKLGSNFYSSYLCICIKQQPFTCLLFCSLGWAQVDSLFCWFNLVSLSTSWSSGHSPRATWSRKARATWLADSWGCASGYFGSLSLNLKRLAQVFHTVVAMFQENNHQCRNAYQASACVIFTDACWPKQVTGPCPWTY